MNRKKLIWPFLAAILTLHSCSEEDGFTPSTDPSTKPTYTCSYEIHFAKDILSYADVVIAMKDPATLTVHRDTIENLQDIPSFCSIQETSLNNIPFISCKATFTQIPEQVHYQLYCNYLLNEEKSAQISQDTKLQYQKAGTSIICKGDDGSTQSFTNAGATSSASFEFIKRIYEISPTRFEQTHEGTFPQ